MSLREDVNIVQGDISFTIKDVPVEHKYSYIEVVKLTMITLDFLKSHPEFLESFTTRIEMFGMDIFIKGFKMEKEGQ